MPYRVSCTPSIFQCFINDVLRDMLVHFVIAYISDSSSHEIHIQHIKRVLAYLLENQLDAKEDKCEFNVTTVSFLDYVFIQEGITMDQAKVTVVTGWPTSSNCFVRFAILNTKLPSWNRDAEEAFHKLITLFTTVPVLQHPDNAKPFVVEVDASESGWEQCYPSALERSQNYILWPFSLRSYGSSWQ